MNNKFKSSKKQNGVVLVVSMIMLLLLTIMGISGMQTTSLEEKMAGNLRDRNIGFQVAEAALRHGEQFVVDGNANANANMICQRQVDEDDRDFRDRCIDEGKQQGPFDIPVASNLNTAELTLSAQPTYTITLLAVNYFGAIRYATFQITATGLGVNGTTVVRLRSIYIATVEDSSSTI